MTTLPFSIERTIEIRATRATVFRYFTDSGRWARWWGAGSTIDPVVGGPVRIVYPGNTVVIGEVREIDPDRRILFTYGYEGSAPAIAPGGSLVTIRLEDTAAGTRLHFRHDVADAAVRDHHDMGWRYQLAVFAHVVSQEAMASAEDTVAALFGAWNALERDDVRRRLDPIVTEDVTFADPFGLTRGKAELVDQILAIHKHVAGVHLESTSALRAAHGTGAVEWSGIKDGRVVMRGTNVFRFAPDGKIAEVVGLPARP